jgi:hypothetical protein
MSITIFRLFLYAPSGATESYLIFLLFYNLTPSMGPSPFIFRYNNTLSKRDIEDCLYNYMRPCPQFFESGIGIWRFVFVLHLKAKIALTKPKKNLSGL